MATINEKILDAAFSDGLIDRSLSENQLVYLNPSVCMANRIYHAIASLSKDGCDFEQVCFRLRIDKNTFLLYSRWLQRKGLITIIPNKLEGADLRILRNCYIAL